VRVGSGASWCTRSRREAPDAGRFAAGARGSPDEPARYLNGAAPCSQGVWPAKPFRNDG
jgi:hypothetical protein